MLWKKICTSSLLLLTCSFALFAGGGTDHYMLKDENNTAVKGFDVISFYDRSPVKGSEDYQTEYAEVKWNFANQENLDKFLQSPSEYLPKYHGYCAYAISEDRLREGMVEYWHVYDGDLYFLCSEEAMKHFHDDPDGLSERADQNWQNMLEKALSN